MGALFGTVAAPLIFIGLAGLGVLVTVIVVFAVNRQGDAGAPPVLRDDSGAARIGPADDSGLPKII